jgi:predicted membrane chloride channel (bestrophin family)
LELLLLLMKGSTIPKIAPQLSVVFGLIVVVMFIERPYSGAFRSFAPPPLTLMGIALSVFPRVSATMPAMTGGGRRAGTGGI